jgi:hypothetical protein
MLADVRNLRKFLSLKKKQTNALAGVKEIRVTCGFHVRTGSEFSRPLL